MEHLHRLVRQMPEMHPHPPRRAGETTVPDTLPLLGNIESQSIGIEHLSPPRCDFRSHRVDLAPDPLAAGVKLAHFGLGRRTAEIKLRLPSRILTDRIERTPHPLFCRLLRPSEIHRRQRDAHSESADGYRDAGSHRHWPCLAMTAARRLT